MSKFEDATLDIKKLDGGVNDGVTADLIGDDQWSYARNIYGIEGSVKSRAGSKRLGTLSQGSLKLDGTGDYLTVPSDQKLTNGSFETWTAGDAVAPDGWTLAGAGAAVAKESTTIKVGTYSAKLTRNGTDCYLQQDYTASGGHNIAYWKGRTVTLGCWVYTANPTKALVQLIHSAATDFGYVRPTLTSTWEYVTVTGVVPTGATSIEARLQVDSTDTTAYFDGAFVTDDAVANFNFGSGDFTIDTWARFATVADSQDLFSSYANAGQFFDFYWYQPTGVLTFYAIRAGTTVSLFTCPWTPVVDTFYHIELTRSGTTMYVFINGVSQTLTISNAIGTQRMPEVDATFVIGTGGYSGLALNGYLDEFRVSKGIARHTADFTPSTALYASDDDTMLLLHFDNLATGVKTFTDSSSRVNTVTGVADAQISQAVYKGLTPLTTTVAPIVLISQIQSGASNYNFAAWNHQLFSLEGTTPPNVYPVRLKNNFNTSAGFGFPMVGFFNFAAVKNAVICNGIQTPVRWDGTSAGVVNLSGSAYTTADQFINYDNYGLLYDFDRLQIQRSNLNDANAGYGSNTPYVIPTKERGDIGSGMVQFGDELIATTRRSVHKFTKTGVSATPFTRREVTSHVGNVAPRGMLVMDNGLLFVDVTGIYFYDGALLVRASKDIDGTWGDINKDYMHGIQAVNYKPMNWAVFAVPYGSGQATNNLFLAYDYLESSPGAGKFVWWMFDGTTAQAMGIMRSSNLTDEWWTGDNQGVLSIQDSGTNDDGVAFTQEGHQKSFDFKKPNRDKRLHECRYIVDGSGDWDLTVQQDIDLSNAPANTTSINLNVPGNLWDVMIWDVDTWEGSSGTLQLRKKFASTLRGRFIQHRFSLSGLDQYFRLYRYMPAVSIKNARGRDTYE
jgi:hypothetical protein